MSDLDTASNAYERAEAVFLAAVRDQAPRSVVAEAVRNVASAAQAFNAEAYRRLHAGQDNAWMPLDHLTERTEVLSELWQDLAAAYAETSPHHPTPRVNPPDPDL